MTKVWGHSKRASLRKKGGKFDKRVTKSDVGEGFTAKKSDVIHSKKKHDILRVTFFLNGPYDDVLLCCIFMNVFVDGVIRFL